MGKKLRTPIIVQISELMGSSGGGGGKNWLMN